MMTLPDSPPPPPPPHAFRSALRRRNRSCEIESCSDSLRLVNLSRNRSCEIESCSDSLPLENDTSDDDRSSYGDGIVFSAYDDGKGFYAEKLQFCSSHRFKANTDKGEDDDDDGMQWANAMRPLRTALRSFGYGDDKGFYAAKMASSKENKVRFPCKLASSPSSIARQQLAGSIKPNSGPFAGPLRRTAKPNSVVKPHIAPSIIPVNLLCKKLLGFDVCEPMSPEVTCLGRIKIKESPQDKVVHATTDDKPSALTQKVEKGRCFDTKNQLCGKKPKGRKKKKIAEKARCLSRRRRFVSKEAADSQSFSSSACLELGETRREKAAFLARCLTNLLEDARRLEKDNAHYIPSVPPPNSLLLMRGGRMRDETCSPIRRNMDEATINECHVHDSQKGEALDEDDSCEASVKNLRNSARPHLCLLDLIDMEDEDFSTTEMEDTMTTQKTRAKAQGRSLSAERENFEAVENDDKKNECVVEGSSLMRPPGAALWQRRAIAELTPIEVKPHTKQKKKQIIIR